MNALGIQFVWCSIQVTIVLFVGALVQRVWARNNPARGSFVGAFFMGLTLITTGLAFSPTPAIWRYPPSIHGDTELNGTVTSNHSRPGDIERPSDLSDPNGRSDRSTSEGQNRHRSRSKWADWSLQFARQLSIHRGPESESIGDVRIWPVVVSVLGLVGVAGHLSLLLFGAWQLRRMVRRSDQLRDAGVLKEIELLRQSMGVSSAVDARESSEIGCAATVGWRSPTLLLPITWREWSDEELRLVIAHELAHIRRKDFATWVLARICLSLHFYHPLVRWSVGHLQLQQEYAADEAAQRLAKTRRDYLRVMASMVLRHDESRMNGLARAFLPMGNSISRRIAMLQQPKGLSLTEPSAVAKWALATIGIGIVVVATTFRMNADEPPGRSAATAVAREQDRRDDKTSASAKEAPSASSDGNAGDAQPKPVLSTKCGAWRIRPAKLFSTPGTQTLLPLMNSFFTDTVFTGERKAEVKLEFIDEVGGPYFLGYDPNLVDRNRSLQTSVDHLTLSPHVNIFEQVKKLFPSTKVTRTERAVMYEVPAAEAPTVFPWMAQHATEKSPVCLLEFAPHTLWGMLSTRENTVQYLDGSKRWTIAQEEFPIWKRVDRGVASFVINDEFAKHEEFSRIPDDADPSTTAFLQFTKLLKMAAGVVEVSRDVQVELIFVPSDEVSMDEFRVRLEACFETIKKVEEPFADYPVFDSFLRELLNSSTITTTSPNTDAGTATDRELVVKMHAELSWVRLADAIGNRSNDGEIKR